MTYDEFQASEEKPEKKKKNTKRKRSPSPPAKVRTSQIICKRENLRNVTKKLSMLKKRWRRTDITFRREL